MGGGIDPMGGVTDRELMGMQAASRAREKVQDLVGERQQPYQMSEAELFPGEAQATLAPGLMTKGKGLVGGEISPLEFYGGLMSVPGSEQIGAQGIAGIMSREGLMARQLAKDSTTSKADLSKIDFDRSEKLRKGFEGQTKDFVKVRDAYRRIGASAEDPSAAGDMAMIFNYMKVLDPGSTVREGEYATAKQATGVPGYVMNLYNQAKDGKLLNVTQRGDFLNRAEKLYTAQLGGLAQLENQYTGLARNYGLNPKNIIVDYRVKEKEKKKTPPPPAGFK